MALPRTLEPELMDSPEEARDYDAMDHSEVNRAFVDDLVSAAADLLQQAEADEVRVDVLDLGTGTALIPIEICRRTPQVRVLAADAAIHMLDQARLNVEIAGVRDQVLLDYADCKAMPHHDGMFAIVMSNSIVHHIPEPKAVLQEAVRLTRPGGLIFIRDLLRPAHQQQLQQLVDQYASTANDHQRAMFTASLHAALNLDEIRALVVELGFAAESVQATSDRHWTLSSLK